MQAFMNILQKNSFETNSSFEKSPVMLLKQSPDELQLLATHPDFYFFILLMPSRKRFKRPFGFVFNFFD